MDTNRSRHYRLRHACSPSVRWFRLLIGAVILLLGTTACDSFSPSADDYLADGRKATAAGDTKSAIISFKNAAQKAPDNPEIRYELGLAYLRSGSFVNAEKELTRAVEMRPDDPAYNLAAARTEVRLRNWADVETYLEGSENWASDLQASALAMRARVQLSAKQTDAARLVVNEALAMSPENTDALYARAVIELTDDDTAAARETLTKVTQLDAKHAQALGMLGILEYYAKNYDEASSLLLAARAVEYADLESTLALARVYLAQEQYDQAGEELAKLLAAMPNAWYPNYLQSLISLRERDYRVALQHSETALNANPEYLPAYFVAAVAAAALGEYESARTRVNKVLYST
ncbi:MAG: tetratricopeptide repeat protein, partial [Halioglobus sp.]